MPEDVMKVGEATVPAPPHDYREVLGGPEALLGGTKKPRQRKARTQGKYTDGDDSSFIPPNPAKTDREIWRDCMDVAYGYVCSIMAIGFASKIALRKASIQYQTEWEELGLMLNPKDPAYNAVKVKKFRDWARQTLYEWRNDEEEMNLFRENKEAILRNTGLWIHKPEARLLELQELYETNSPTMKGDKPAVALAILRTVVGMQDSVGSLTDSDITIHRVVEESDAGRKHEYVVHLPPALQAKADRAAEGVPEPPPPAEEVAVDATGNAGPPPVPAGPVAVSVPPANDFPFEKVVNVKN